MKLPTWFKKTTPAATGAPRAAAAPTAASLAESVAEAESSLAAALQRVDAARATLGHQRTEEALKGVQEAKAAADDIEEMLAVLRADHATAVEREAAGARAELERQCADLEAQLTVDAILMASRDLAQQEAKAILELATIRKNRLQRVAHYTSLQTQHQRLLFRLGKIQVLGTSNGNADQAGSPVPVVEAFKGLLRASSHDSGELRELLRPLWPNWGILSRARGLSDLEGL